MKSVDEAALRELRDSSRDLTSWWSNSENSPSEWEGVSCNDQGLIQLDFSGCPRLDKLPPEIGKLQESLDQLNLNNLGKDPYFGRQDNSDQLTMLPTEIGNLKALTVLDLMLLKKLKALPPEIGELERLTKLFLNWDTSLKTLPSEIGKLANLTELDLFMCWDITSLPPAIRNLKALTKLNLRCCGSLEVIPSEIFELSNLTFLSLAGCKAMREVPNKIGNLKSLTELELDSCENLTYLPSEIGELEKLEVLQLYENKQLKSLPSSICNLHHLKSLDLKKCAQLEELPSNIGQLQALITLDLYDCSGLKELPASFGQLTTLTNLNIGRCRNLVLPQDVKPIDGTDAIIRAYANELIFEPYKDKPRDFYRHLQNNRLLVPSLFKYILPQSKYADWLGKVVEATPKIVEEEDDSGRIMIEAAHPMCKKKMKAALHLISKPEVGENQCLANGVLIDLPDKVIKSVAESVFDLIFEAARNGVGEKKEASGMIVVIGSPDDFDKVGYCDEAKNTFEGKSIDVRNWQDFKELILPCFVKDGALYIDGKTGRIMADGFIIDLSTRNADKGGGTGHRNASAAGGEGCLAIKCSEDCCATDGKGKKDLKVFLGTKEPTMIPVAPTYYYEGN